MNRASLEELAKAGHSTRDIARTLSCSQANVKYWLKKFGLKTRRGPRNDKPKDLLTPRKCPCGETRPEMFYGDKTRACRECHRKYTVDRGRATRKWIIAQLGGKCSSCGYCKNEAALDTHHTDPAKKDLSFARSRGWCKSRLIEELKFCVLLCSNCHRELHNPL